MKKRRRRLLPAFLLAILLCGYMPSAEAQALYAAVAFIQGALSPPRRARTAMPGAASNRSNADVKNQPHRVLFLGRLPLTEGFDREVWEQLWRPRGCSMPGSAAIARPSALALEQAISMARRRTGSCC
jgi:hypothetical protein